VVVSAQVHRRFSSLSASIKVVYANGDGEYEDLFNEDLIELGLARTTTFSHEHSRREFERLREEAEERGAGLWRLL
jgi:nuclease-like protein